VVHHFDDGLARIQTHGIALIAFADQIFGKAIGEAEPSFLDGVYTETGAYVPKPIDFSIILHFNAALFAKLKRGRVRAVGPEHGLVEGNR
jgi:hypothetical protein